MHWRYCQDRGQLYPSPRSHLTGTSYTLRGQKVYAAKAFNRAGSARFSPNIFHSCTHCERCCNETIMYNNWGEGERGKLHHQELYSAFRRHLRTQVYHYRRNGTCPDKQLKFLCLIDFFVQCMAPKRLSEVHQARHATYPYTMLRIPCRNGAPFSPGFTRSIPAGGRERGYRSCLQFKLATKKAIVTRDLSPPARPPPPPCREVKQ